jgi:hypothetical protein
MRRALQVDPRVLADMHIDARLVPLVEDLVERSRSRLASDEKDDQGAALRASLACLLREEPPAHDAEPVVESGDPPAAVMEEKEEEEETAAVAPIPDQAPPARGQSDLPRLEVDYNKLQEDLAGTAAVLDRFTKKLLALHRRPEGLRQQASDSLIGTQ